jgi:hypothetical protein
MIDENHTMKHDDDLQDDEFDENAKIFPQRLMEILSEPSNADAITWLPHGEAFIIINRQKFSNHILPKYFRKTKYTSFTRKLNRWNFSRVTRGPELGAYYHEFFQRGNEALCTQMYCKNDRAKFAVSLKASGKKQSKELPETKQTKPSTPQISSVEQIRPLPATQLMHMSGLFAKANTPNLQATRAALLGQQSMLQQKDPLTQSLINNAIATFSLQNQGGGAALFRMHQLAAMQQQFQNQQQGPKTTIAFNNYRASAA